MSSSWIYNTVFTEFSGIVSFSLTLIVNSDIPSPTSLITSVSGNIIYSIATGFTTTSNISLLAPGTFIGAPLVSDNILNSSTTPFFTPNGFIIRDNTNLLDYQIFNNDDVDNVYNDNNSNTVPFSLETLSLACILSLPTTKILSCDGYKHIEEIKIGDIIISENNRKIKINNILNSKFNIDIKNKRYFPFKINKGEYGCIEDVYISPGHCIKFNNKFYLPSELKLQKCSINDLEKLNIKELNYYHFSLEREEKETRRTNTLLINGVIMESFSNEKF